MTDIDTYNRSTFFQWLWARKMLAFNIRDILNRCSERKYLAFTPRNFVRLVKRTTVPFQMADWNVHIWESIRYYLLYDTFDVLLSACILFACYAILSFSQNISLYISYNLVTLRFLPASWHKCCLICIILFHSYICISTAYLLLQIIKLSIYVTEHSILFI